MDAVALLGRRGQIALRSLDLGWKGLGKSGRVLCPHAHGDAVFGLQTTGFGGVQPGGMVQQLVSTLQQLLAALVMHGASVKHRGSFVNSGGAVERRVRTDGMLRGGGENVCRTKVVDLKKGGQEMV